MVKFENNVLQFLFTIILMSITINLFIFTAGVFI